MVNLFLWAIVIPLPGPSTADPARKLERNARRYERLRQEVNVGSPATGQVDLGI